MEDVLIDAEELRRLVRTIYEHREFSECWHGTVEDGASRGDCGNWENCDPDCVLTRLREHAGFKAQADGGLDKQG